MSPLSASLLVLALFLQTAADRPAPTQHEVAVREEIPTGTEGFALASVKLRAFARPTVVVQAATFDSDRFELRVLDQPGPKRKPLVVEASDAGAVAGINASYFHPDYTPLGLVVSGGKQVHGREKADLLSGMAGQTEAGPFVVRADAFPPKGMVREAVQAGPFLVDGGKPVEGLNDVRQARRSIVWTDGKKAWGLIVTDPMTLREVAGALVLKGLIPGVTIERALNLDGGSSAAFWARAGGRDYSISEYGTVRNFLLAVPRTPSPAGN
jgi:uncharacterized protein YigE (DUF2233 family)